MRPPARLVAALPPVLAAAPAGPIGVAVSGGGDSVALLLLLNDWARGAGREIAAITIDHGLRPESAAEAHGAARLCARLDVAHDVRRWSDRDGRGNLQAAARDARRRLIAGWAGERGIGAVALGHTLDDQAETFLMRLARGSGVYGLAAMAAVAPSDGLVWLRPLLGLRRGELRDWLTAEGVAWVEDPGNADARFDRVRARAALAPLSGLGLGPERLAATAARMGRARAALDAATAALARACLTAEPTGDLTLDPAGFAVAPEEVRLRLLAGALAWVAGARVRPRLGPLEAACALVTHGGLAPGLTLHGCVLRPSRGRIAIRREPARAAGPAPLARGAWDGRWAIEGAPSGGVEGVAIAALGRTGLAERPDWRASGLAREALLTTPALWRGDRLACAPLLEPGGPVAARRIAALPPPWGGGELR